MNGERKAVLPILRWVGLISAVTAGALVAVLLVYIAYVYNLWMHAMRAEGTPGAPPP